MTEKVRLKSVIERTRLHVVRLMEGSVSAPDPPTESVRDIGERTDIMDIEIGGETDVDGDNIEDEEWEIEVAKIYDRSLVQIGESLKEG